MKKPDSIELRCISKAYEENNRRNLAVNNISATFRCGEFTAIVGISGSGKTTLLNMISGIDRPTSGEVIHGENQLHNMSENELAKWRGKFVGIVFQFFQLIPTLTVIENLLLPMDFCGIIPANQRRRRAVSLLERVDIAQHAYMASHFISGKGTVQHADQASHSLSNVDTVRHADYASRSLPDVDVAQHADQASHFLSGVGIVQYADKLPHFLSGGEQQRVAIARSLVNDPLFILADEPTGNLDTKNAEHITRLLRDLASEGKAVIMVTHNKEMAGAADRIISINDGKIISDVNNSNLQRNGAKEKKNSRC